MPHLDEFPAKTIPDIPHWSENYCLDGFDPKSGIGFWIHIGRWRKDLRQWREIVTIALPDGTVLTHRAVGLAHATARGPGGPNLAVTVDEPEHRLSFRFLGAARRLPREALLANTPLDGPLTRLEFELVFASHLPIWDISSVADSNAVIKGHIEQVGKATGTIVVGTQRFTFDGFCNRDHSVGTRETVAMRGHHWIQGSFDNGCHFLLYDLEMSDPTAPGFSTACVVRQGELIPARLELPARAQSLADEYLLPEFTLHFGSEKAHIATTKIARSWALSYTAPNELYVGIMREVDSARLIEQSAHFVLDGTVNGIGHIERSFVDRIGREEDQG